MRSERHESRNMDALSSKVENATLQGQDTYGGGQAALFGDI